MVLLLLNEIKYFFNIQTQIILIIFKLNLSVEQNKHFLLAFH